jgi:hypothetical protein
MLVLLVLDLDILLDHRLHFSKFDSVSHRGKYIFDKFSFFHCFSLSRKYPDYAIIYFFI